MYKAEYIFARIIFPFGIGIWTTYVCHNPNIGLWLWLCTTTLFLSLLYLNFFYRKFRYYRIKGLLGMVLFMFFFFFGGVLNHLHDQRNSALYFANYTFSALRILVSDDPRLINGIVRFKARIKTRFSKDKEYRSSGLIMLSIQTDTLNPITLNYGDEVIVTTKPTLLEPAYNPGEFNSKAWLESQNIYHQAFIQQNQLLLLHKNSGNLILKFALKLRKKQVEKYALRMYNKEALAVAATLILGDRADLSKETLSTYSKTGTIHALSVSGAHVAIIYVVLDFLLSFLNAAWIQKSIKFVLIFTLIWFYALLTGLSPSVVRSAIMISAFIIANTYAQNKNSYNILAFAAFCQLVYNPFYLWDVGFQLSYLSVFGLVYIQPKIYAWMYLKNKWIDKVWGFIAMSGAAQIATFPLSIYYFHQFPVYFLFSNLFITIPLIVMMYLGILALVPGLSFLTPVLEWVINHTNIVLKWIADLPYATVSSIWISQTELVLLSLALGLMIYACARFNKKVLFFAVFVFIAYQSKATYENIKHLNQKKIIFYSMRKNYATAFIHGRNAIVITDLQETDNLYKFTIKPSLDSFQVTKVYCCIPIHQDTIIGNFVSRNHQMAFFGYKILILDKRLDRKKLTITVPPNLFWVHNNPFLDSSKSRLKFMHLPVIIDASNKAYKVKYYTKLIEKNAGNAYILKKNKAYLIDIN